MNNEVVLLESRTLRGSLVERTEALEKVRALTMLPDGVHVTSRMVADYFGVGDVAVSSVVDKHGDELRSSGYTVLKGAELQEFLSVNMKPRKLTGNGLRVFPRPAVLNVAMLLRDSPVARDVRQALLDLVDAERAAVVAQEQVAELLVVQQDLRERIRRLEGAR